MPIYVFDCRACGPFELLLPLSKSDQKRARCKCGRFGSRAAPLTTMRPDKYWSGVVDRDYGYITSETQLKAEMEQRNHIEIGDHYDRDAMRKVVEKGIEAREKKARQGIRQWAEKTFGPEGLGLGGADGAKIIKENS